MRRAAGSLEFAHARIWARWGARADEALWHRIEVTRGLSAVLDLARASTLARWVGEIGAEASPHTIEHALRARWCAVVAELASWMPPAWGSAVEWCAPLPDLPLLQHLARGAAAPAWCADDAEWRLLLAHDEPGKVDGHTVALRALLGAARADPDRLASLWLARWRDRLPAGAGREAIEQRLWPLLQTHAAAFGAPDAVDGWALRAALRARLVLLLRRALVEPLAAFVYLALTALEAERLRAELVARAAFPHRTPAR